MTTPQYVYDQAWEHERARLAGIEAMWDADTERLLAELGARPGAAVCEVGAGGGSIVQWLADRVGTGGRVLAVDLDTRFVDPLASEVVEVRRADVVRDEVAEGEFDVVHARLLLEHLPEAEAVVGKLAAALRPGGALLIEDYDWTGFGFDPADEHDQRGAEAIISFMRSAGFDPVFGRRLVSMLSSAGLVDVRGAGRSLVVEHTHPGYAFFRLSFDQLAPAAVKAGFLAESDAQVVGDRLRSGDAHRVITPVLVAASGRRPE